MLGGPTTEEVYRRRAKPIIVESHEHGDRKGKVWVVVVEHILHNVEVVIYYELINSYAVCLGIQAYILM